MPTRFLRYRSTLRGRARSLRRDPTPAERRLWYDVLRDLPQKFTRQKPLGRFIVDFYCASRALAIEVDGDSHYDPGAIRYDQERTASLQAVGIRVLRFTNEDVMEKLEGVREEILAALRA
jgi:very-short-patch-repair endonuclease